jgi:hypothetical protein
MAADKAGAFWRRPATVGVNIRANAPHTPGVRTYSFCFSWVGTSDLRSSGERWIKGKKIRRLLSPEGWFGASHNKRRKQSIARFS